MIFHLIYLPVGDTNAVDFIFFDKVEDILRHAEDSYINTKTSGFDALLYVHLSTHRNLLFIAGLYYRLNFHCF